jgi:hypothetical protein
MKTLAAALLIALATTAQATTIHLHGTITDVEGTPLSSPFEGGEPIMVDVGDPFTGTLVFNPNQPFDEFGNPNVFLEIFITTTLGTFSYTLDTLFSSYTGGFGPSIAGEVFGSSLTLEELMHVEFLSPDLHSFAAGMSWTDFFAPNPFLGSVQATGVASVPESASTLTLFAFGLPGVAILLWTRKKPRNLRFT